MNDLTAEEIREEMRFLMASGIGQRFIRRLITETGVYRSSYVSGQPDSRLPFFEGQRNIGLMIRAWAVSTDIGLFYKIMGDYDG